MITGKYITTNEYWAVSPEFIEFTTIEKQLIKQFIIGRAGYIVEKTAFDYYKFSISICPTAPYNCYTSINKHANGYYIDEAHEKDENYYFETFEDLLEYMDKMIEE